MATPTPWPHEQPAGAPLVDPVDPVAVDLLRQQTYESYESFLRHRLITLDRDRPAQWHRDYRDVDTYVASVEPMRRRFANMLGYWSDPGQRPSVAIRDEQLLLETDAYSAYRFMYEPAPGLWTYAIRLKPHIDGPRPGLLVQHGYLATPEMAVGFAASANREDYTYRSLGIRAAMRGYHVIAPHHPSGFGTTSDTVDAPLPGHPKQTVHYGKNRLHRLCILGGGTLLGLDMLASSRALDILAARADVQADRLGVYGLSRGGQTALYLPALDTRVRAAVSAAYFNTRLQKLIGPYPSANYVDWFGEGQILPDIVASFADSDLVSLIAPRAFAVEAGAKDSSVDQAAAFEEFARAAEHYTKLDLTDHVEFIAHDGGHISATGRALDFLDLHLGKPSS